MSTAATGQAMPECLSMGPSSNDYSAAEGRVLDAVCAGELCDFADGAEITAEELASWGPERTIRATLLRRLLTAEDGQYAAFGVRLRGAAVDGVLDLQDMSVIHLDLQDCRIATLQARGAAFTGEARFINANFTRDAMFTNATFTRHAMFNHATFIGTAFFTKATFTGKALFTDATFIGAAEFIDTTFTRLVWFSRATFTRDALFTNATFNDDAGFSDAIADSYVFTTAQFHTTRPGPWVARQVTLTGAVFHVRARAAVATLDFDCRQLQAREGALRCPRWCDRSGGCRVPAAAHPVAFQFRACCSQMRRSWGSPRRVRQAHSG